MGIKGLIPFIRENAAKAVREINSQQEYNGKILAIDASTCLYQFLVAIKSGTGESYQNLTNEKGETTSHLAGFMTRTLKLLEAGVKPVYVFDGKPPSKPLFASILSNKSIIESVRLAWSRDTRRTEKLSK